MPSAANISSYNSTSFAIRPVRPAVPTRPLPNPHPDAEPVPVVAQIGEGGAQIEPDEVPEPAAVGKGVESEGEGDEEVGLGEDVAAERIELRMGEDVSSNVSASEEGRIPEHIEPFARKAFPPFGIEQKSQSQQHGQVEGMQFPD